MPNSMATAVKMNGVSRCLGKQFTQYAKAPLFRKCNTIPFRLSGISIRSYSDRSPKYNGNMTSQPPKNEMVYMPGVMSPNRSFGVFRKVLHTGLYSQFVAMEVPVNGEIGDEIHTVDQVLIFTHGTGKAIVAGKEQEVTQNDVVIVPAGTQHQFLNIGNTPLEVVTIYSPAEHDPRTVHQTKAEGDAQEEAGEDEAPEWSQRSKSENEKIGLVKTS